MLSVALVEHCFISFRSYGMKQGISWNFFLFLSILLILCLLDHDINQHVQQMVY